MILNLVLAAFSGWGLGYLIRRITPYLLGKKDKSSPFSWPWVELMTAICFMALALHGDLEPWSLKWYLFALLLMAISSTDFLSKLIPDSLTFGGTFFGIVLAMISPGEIHHFLSQGAVLQYFSYSPSVVNWQTGLILSISGAVMGFCTLELIRRIIGRMTGMEVMGVGDSCILMMIGSFLGPKMVLISIFPASIFGILIGLYFKWFKNSPHSPFGPALALGGLVQYLYWQHINGSIDGFYSIMYSLPRWVIGIFGLILLCILFVLILRIKNRAAEYERLINEDYDQITKDLED